MSPPGWLIPLSTYQSSCLPSNTADNPKIPREHHQAPAYIRSLTHNSKTTWKWHFCSQVCIFQHKNHQTHIRFVNQHIIHCKIESNTSRPGDAIWQHRSRSPLSQVMAWFLTKLSHYLDHCWLINTVFCGMFFYSIITSPTCQWVN